jgi:hypothetical protein
VAGGRPFTVRELMHDRQDEDPVEDLYARTDDGKWREAARVCFVFLMFMNSSASF